MPYPAVPAAQQQPPMSSGPDATMDFSRKLADPQRLTRVRAGSRAYYSIYLCKCGNEKEIYDYSVRKGASTSCGCRNVEVVTARNAGNTYGVKHGGWRTSEYAVWEAMIARCENKRASGYQDYGGRGITVCARWRNSFADFLADMGPRPSLKYSIDRENNEGNYEPGNCRWATRKQQNRNKRNNRLLTLGTKTQCVTAWCEELKIAIPTLTNRINRGWTDVEALTIPIQKKKVQLA